MFQNDALKAQKIPSLDTLSSVWHGTVPKRWLEKWEADSEPCAILLPFAAAHELRSWKHNSHESKYYME